MNTTHSEQPLQPDPGADRAAETTAGNVIDYFFDGVGDSTVRPMRSPVLRQIRPDQPPPPPPEKK